MIRQIKLLTGLQLCNLFRFNEFRHTKDKRKRLRFLGIGLAVLVLMVILMCYVGAVTYGLCSLNLGSLVPGLLAMEVAVITLFFTFFKAESVIFSKRGLDLCLSLPVSHGAVIVSRFLTLYVTNLCLSICVMFVGIAVYGYMEKPAVYFYLYGLIGALFLPLLPITIAVMLGAGIAALSAGFKHKSIIASILSLGLATAVFLGSMGMSGTEETRLTEMLESFADLLSRRSGQIYPPALWLGHAMCEGDMLSFLLFMTVSVFLFVVVEAVLQRFFLKICTGLYNAAVNEPYQMKGLSVNSIRKDLWKKELKYYFSSSVYVTNTMLGYVLMVVIAAAVLVTGEEKIAEITGMGDVVRKMLPVLLGAMPVMMPMTACSVSLEGKKLWILQTLPIQRRDILLSKIAANLTVVLPFYIISEIIMIAALRPSATELFWLVAVPAAYIIFGAVVGISVNLKFPVFDWENEVQVIKQSVAGFVMILIGFASAALPVIFLLGAQAMSANLIFAGTLLVLLGSSGILASRWFL